MRGQLTGIGGPLPPSFPENWRELVLQALTKEGVSHPSHIPRWRAVADFLCAVTLVTLIFFLPLLLTIIFSNGFKPDTGVVAAFSQHFQKHSTFWLSSTSLLVAMLGYAWIVRFKVWRYSASQFRTSFGGANALKAIESAQQPPVLYLRAFNLDYFSEDTRRFPILEMLAAFPILNFIFPQRADPQELQAVRYLRQHAPVIAIGRPGEPEPPSGALRFYVIDEQWKTTIDKLLPVSQLIIVATGQGAGLNWEISRIVQTVPPSRLILWPHIFIGAWKADDQALEWDYYIAEHNHLFPKDLPKWEELRGRGFINRRCGRFLAFDKDWTPICIPNSEYPAKIMDAIDFSCFFSSSAGLRALMRKRRQGFENLASRG